MRKITAWADAYRSEQDAASRGNEAEADEEAEVEEEEGVRLEAAGSVTGALLIALAVAEDGVSGGEPAGVDVEDAEEENAGDEAVECGGVPVGGVLPLLLVAVLVFFAVALSTTSHTSTWTASSLVL